MRRLQGKVALVAGAARLRSFELAAGVLRVLR
jgi:hypothetical protein